MNSNARPGKAVRAFALGTLLVGVLDILDAFLFFGARGAQPVRILQSIASGLLGAAAFEGGAASALLGAILHFTNACIIVAAYYAVSRFVPALRRRVLLWGPLYGVLVYCVMNFVVIPLSAVARGGFTWPVVLNGLLIHIFGVGIPAVWVARDRDSTKVN
jgi:hypothetical protein